MQRSDLSQLLGTWETEAVHRSMPDTLVRGTAVMEWVDGGRFLSVRARTDHPKFPDSLCVIGVMSHHQAKDGDAPTDGELRMHYYDSRGVFRDFAASIDATAWRLEIPIPGFHQRFIGTFADGGATIHGMWQLDNHGAWEDDLKITYRRRQPASAS